MNWVRLSSAKAFLEKSESSLLQYEAEHGLILGSAARLRVPGSRLARDPHFYFGETSRGELAHALRTEPDKPLAISRMSGEAARSLAGFLDVEKTALAGVVGPVGAVEPFSNEWRTLTGARLGSTMAQGIYQLTAVVPARVVPGRFAMGSPVDLPWVSRWMLEFLRESHPMDENREGEARGMSEFYLGSGRLFFWIDEEGEPMAMAAHSRETLNGATVSYVYTPPPLRGKGFASAVVAALSQRLLGQGFRFCSLYTDLSNPVSNSLYRRIGYRQIAESRHDHFYLLNPGSLPNQLTNRA